jgi:hypothetical protein
MDADRQVGGGGAFGAVACVGSIDHETHHDYVIVYDIDYSARTCYGAQMPLMRGAFARRS